MTISQGLSEVEAKKRLSQVGYNELPTSKKQGVLEILSQVLHEPMLLLLVCCGIIYILTGETRDGLLLFASALVVVGITLYQEVKSERALESLRNLSSPRALVFRDGVIRRIPGREVVPGDLIRVVEGDRIPADAVLISSTHLALDESLLTGESYSVTKAEFKDEFSKGLAGASSSNTLYCGTLTVGGEGLAVVTGTGLKTELGKIGRSLESVAGNKTPLQLEVDRMIRVFGTIGVICSFFITLVYGFTRNDWAKGVLAGLSAAMSLLPEEFPVIMTVFLAMGAWRISRRNVLTRRVAAIEALGAVSALCVDKTGTLTQNQMVVHSLASENQRADLTQQEVLTEELVALLEVARLACHENPFDPMEKAVFTTANHFIPALGGLKNRKLQALYPLSSTLMAMSCVWKIENQTNSVVAAKGAPEAILQLCHCNPAESERVLSQVQWFASQGLRVLALASASIAEAELPKDQHDFSFKYLGLIAFADPIRPQVPAAIQECREAGIRVIMLTGDYPETAKNIAQQLGIPHELISGPEVSAMDDLQLQDAVRKVSIFARVTPEQKLRIVTALKATGERVAMTGDGVNDAPSLKWADIGVAMGGRGTDVAREAAAIVLLDDSFASLVSAIRLGRRIYANLQKAVFFILSIHVAIAGLAILPVVFNLPLLLLPAQIVFLELIIDPACSLVYESEAEDGEVMKRQPRDPRARLVSWRDFLTTSIQGLVILLLVFALYLTQLKTGHSIGEARSAAFLALVLSNLGLIFVHRIQHGGFISTLLRKNTAFYVVSLGAVVLLGLVLVLNTGRSLFGFSKLDGVDYLLSIGVGFLAVILMNGVRILAASRAKI